MLSSIVEIFERKKCDLVDKAEWIEITNLLINNIQIDKYLILKYKEAFDNRIVIENVINHKESHSHSVVYINPKYTEKKLRNIQRITLLNQNAKCISDLWKSNLITTSYFEDKLYYIMSIILDNIDILHSPEISEWLDLVFYMKKKSVNDILQKFTWEVFSQVYTLSKPIYVDNDTYYYTSDTWVSKQKKLSKKLLLLSTGLGVESSNIIPLGEKDLVEIVHK